MAVVKVKTEQDLAKLEHGDAIVFDFDLSRFDDDPDGPIKMLDSEEFAEIERLTALAAERFTPVEVVITVDFDTANKVGITSNVEQTVAISGRVRDNDAVKLTAGKRKTYSLTKEAIDHVVVDGTEYKIPESKDTK